MTAFRATSPATAASATATRTPPSPSADHRIEITVNYPRNACTPIETYGVLAEYDPAADAYDVTANFQGPFSLHAVIARALRVPGNRLRLRTPPDSGGSFGVKQGVFPYIVLIAAAARVAGPAGEMGRGPAGAPRRLRLRHQPRHDAASGGRRRTAASWRWTGIRSRTAAPICARPSRPRCIACTAT